MNRFQYRLKTAAEIGAKHPSPLTEQYGECIVHPTLVEMGGGSSICRDVAEIRYTQTPPINPTYRAKSRLENDFRPKI